MTLLQMPRCIAIPSSSETRILGLSSKFEIRSSDKPARNFIIGPRSLSGCSLTLKHFDPAQIASAIISCLLLARFQHSSISFSNSENSKKPAKAKAPLRTSSVQVADDNINFSSSNRWTLCLFFHVRLFDHVSHLPL